MLSIIPYHSVRLLSNSLLLPLNSYHVTINVIKKISFKIHLLEFDHRQRHLVNAISKPHSSSQKYHRIIGENSKKESRNYKDLINLISQPGM